MEVDRFSLEQQILGVWGITDDIEYIASGIANGSVSKEDVAVILSGLQKLYSLKFDQLFNTFEILVENKKII